MADLGVASRTDMKEHADMLANLDPSKMLIADMDTGYGGKSLLSSGRYLAPSDQRIQVPSLSRQPSISTFVLMWLAFTSKTKSSQSAAAI